jgi:LysR family nitrogen assimilation transcriptional regulator
LHRCEKLASKLQNLFNNASVGTGIPNRRQNELKTTEIFRKNRRYRQPDQAAEVLHIAQPALSQQVATLEGEMDQQLLIRTKRGVTPTEAGKILYTHARTILRQCEQAQLAVNNVGQTLSGHVSIGLAPGTAASPLPCRCCRPVRELPEVLVYLHENSGTVLNDKLLSGQLDMACFMSVLRSPGSPASRC